MVLFDHVKRDLGCLDEETTLLSAPKNIYLQQILNQIYKEPIYIMI